MYVHVYPNLFKQSLEWHSLNVFLPKSKSCLADPACKLRAWRRAIWVPNTSPGFPSASKGGGAGASAGTGTASMGAGTGAIAMGTGAGAGAGEGAWSKPRAAALCQGPWIQFTLLPCCAQVKSWDFKWTNVHLDELMTEISEGCWRPWKKVTPASAIGVDPMLILYNIGRRV